ncbi:MAG: hypothetical protein ACE5EF_01500 [Dehalococcoidia bacterium]
MSTSAPEQPDSIPALGESADALVRKCERCGLSYAPAKSTSSLRLTYCSFLCELGDLGFSISGLEHMERTTPDEEPSEPEAES